MPSRTGIALSAVDQKGHLRRGEDDDSSQVLHPVLGCSVRAGAFVYVAPEPSAPAARLCEMERFAV